MGMSGLCFASLNGLKTHTTEATQKSPRGIN